jgi:phenylacetate-CoA ligase
MILRPVIRAYGSAVILAHLPGQARFPFRSPEAVRARRDAAVRRMVAYAAANVPYYHELFARERIDPTSIRTADDLSRLPLLEKSTVQREPRCFVSQSRAGSTAVRFVTSGTTGSPLEVWHDRRSLLANLAYGERERAMIVRQCGAGPRPREMYVSYPSSTNRRVWAFYEENALLPVRPRRRYVSILDPLDTIVSALDEQRPDVLVSYGSFLELLFKRLAESSTSVHLPRMLVYVADAMTVPGRSFVESRFGVPVFSRYNAMEAFKIAFTCERRDGFHVHEDLCHVRIVRRDGSAASPGEQGEVVLSNLANRGTVLLNYRLGDLASLSPEPCPCGRGLPLLRDLDGRSEDVLCAADGRPVHPRALWSALKNCPGLLRYQIVQETPDRFTLRLMTSDDAAYESIVAAALPRLRKLLGPSASVEPTHEASLDPPDGGKFRAVIQQARAR